MPHVEIKCFSGRTEEQKADGAHGPKRYIEVHIWKKI